MNSCYAFEDGIRCGNPAEFPHKLEDKHGEFVTVVCIEHHKKIGVESWLRPPDGCHSAEK